jgi:hypothetical protein
VSKRESLAWYICLALAGALIGMWLGIHRARFVCVTSPYADFDLSCQAGVR